MYRRRLPHLQRPGKPLFVTFRTHAELKLDPPCRTAVLEHCLHDHGVKLQMHAAVVMPNHVHLLFTPLEDMLGQPFGLVEILSAIKGASAHSVNRILDRRGPVWQEESFDHVLRSWEELEEKIRYIALNPVEVHLSRTPGEYPWLWIEP